MATATAIFNGNQRLTFCNEAYVELWGLDQNWLDTGPEEGEILDKLSSMRRPS